MRGLRGRDPRADPPNLIRIMPAKGCKQCHDDSFSSYLS